MLDLDQIFAAASVVDVPAPCPTGQLGQGAGLSGQPGLSRKNPASMRVSGQFLCSGQAGQGFCSGGGDAHSNSPDNHPIPRAPEGQSVESRPEKGAHPLSHLSLSRESKYLRGFPSVFAGTTTLSRACPACPALHPDELEARIERAAILEFDAGLTRADADAAAGLVDLGRLGAAIQKSGSLLALPTEGDSDGMFPLGRNPRA